MLRCQYHTDTAFTLVVNVKTSSWLIACMLLFQVLVTAEVFGDTAPPVRPLHSIPFKAENQSVGSEVFRVVLSLVVALSVGVGILYGARHYLSKLRGVSVDTRRVRNLEALRLTPRTTLFLIEFDERVLLLSQHGDTFSVLSEKQSTVTTMQAEGKDRPST